MFSGAILVAAGPSGSGNALNEVGDALLLMLVLLRLVVNSALIGDEEADIELWKIKAKSLDLSPSSCSPGLSYSIHKS